MNSLLDDRAVAVAGEGLAADEVALALGGLGHPVIRLHRTGSDPSVGSEAGAGEAVGTWAAALLRAADQASIGALVLVGAGSAPPGRRSILDLEPQEWITETEDPLNEAVLLFAAAHRCLARPGAIVALLSPLGLVGLDGYVAQSAVDGGVRALVRSAARRWGRDGLRCNTVVCSTRALGGALADIRLRDMRGQVPALGPEADQISSSVAPVIAQLIAAPAGGITGATVAVDGGVWMAP